MQYYLSFWPTIGLSFIRYKNKTTFVWCDVCGDHFVCGGGRSPSPCGLRWSSTTTNSVISSHSSPDFGGFIIISINVRKEHNKHISGASWNDGLMFLVNLGHPEHAEVKIEWKLIFILLKYDVFGIFMKCTIINWYLYVNNGEKIVSNRFHYITL